MGGSLGFAIKQRAHVDQVLGYDLSKDICLKAVERGCVDVATHHLADAVEDADLILIASPIDTVVKLVLESLPHLKKGAIISDVASTKQQVVTELQTLPRKDVFFIGGHPMAGSDQSGIAAARSNLFQGALYFLTPTAQTDPESLEVLDQFIQRLTPRVEHISPEKHDAVVALASHLPYMMATVLVQTLMDTHDPTLAEAQPVASSGFRDSSRVAGSPAEWGCNVSLSNAAAILQQLDRYIQNAQRLRQSIAAKDQAALIQFFSRVANFRRQMYADFN